MNLSEMRNLLGHMLNSDPMGIKSPMSHNHNQEVSVMYPVEGIRLDWHDDSVTVTTNEVTFDLLYNNRTEAELASELTDIIDYLNQ